MKPPSFSITCARITVLAWFVAIGAAPAQVQVPNDSARLTLHHAVSLALATHPSLGVARAGERAAVDAVGGETAARWPQLGSTASLIYFEDPMLIRPLHSLDVSQAEFADALIRTDVTLAYTLYDGGARGARISGARAEAAGATASRETIEMKLTARVTGAYLTVLSARGVLDAQDRRIEALTAERFRIEQLLVEGRAAQVELLRVDAALAEAEAARVARATRLDLAERDLARLIDVAPADTRAEHLTSVSLADSLVLQDRAALVARSIASNPELERARQNVQAAEASHRIAIAAWIPRLDIAATSLGYGSTDSDFTLEGQVGIRISYPLFTGGARKSTVGSAEALAEMARQELHGSELIAEENVDRALNAALETRAIVDALARAVRHQTEVTRIEQLSLDAGAGTQTDYLRAVADLTRARSVLVEAKHFEIAARVQLARVLGELTPEWLDQNLESRDE